MFCGSGSSQRSSSAANTSGARLPAEPRQRRDQYLVRGNRLAVLGVEIARCPQRRQQRAARDRRELVPPRCERREVMRVEARQDSPARRFGDDVFGVGQLELHDPHPERTVAANRAIGCRRHRAEIPRR